MEEDRSAVEILTDNLHEWNLQEALGIDGMILESILKKLVSIQGIELIRLNIGIIEKPLYMRH